MKSHPKFVSKTKYFFETTRLISEIIGYSNRKTKSTESTVKRIDI